MKSFHLQPEPKREVVLSIAALLVGVGLFLALRRYPISQTAWRIVAVLAGALVVGYLCRGQLCRTLRQRYPKARWIVLLALGFSIAIFGVVARFTVPGAEEGTFTLAFILPAGACIATFVIVNRRDPDIRR